MPARILTRRVIQRPAAAAENSRPTGLSYASPVARLLACPFCRALYASAEANQCPECAVKLVPMENLPPSLDALTEEHGAGEVILPEQRRLPWHYFGRARGALLVIAVLGLGFFFAPWLEVRIPDESVRSGFDLARGRAGWLWGGAAAWLVLLPLLWTRHTIQRMRGVRLVTVVFAAMTGIEVMLMLTTPPRSTHGVPLEFVWRWGIYASLATSLAGVAGALRLGGNLQNLPRIVTDIAHPDRTETSSGETLH